MTRSEEFMSQLAHAFELMRRNATDPANQHMMLDFVTMAKRAAGLSPPPSPTDELAKLRAEAETLKNDRDELRRMYRSASEARSEWQQWAIAKLGVCFVQDSTRREAIDAQLAKADETIGGLRADLERVTHERDGAIRQVDALQQQARDRGPAITKADARELLEMSVMSTSDACYARVRAALRDYAGGDFECHQPNPLDAAQARIADLESQLASRPVLPARETVLAVAERLGDWQDPELRTLAVEARTGARPTIAAVHADLDEQLRAWAETLPAGAGFVATREDVEALKFIARRCYVASNYTATAGMAGDAEIARNLAARLEASLGAKGGV